MFVMASSRDRKTLPLPVQRLLKKLGGDIRDARLRRRIPAQVLADRASITRTTLQKIERGHHGVSLGNYTMVLFALGLAEGLGEIADASNDRVGLELEEERLPQRVRRSGVRRRKSADQKDPK